MYPSVVSTLVCPIRLDICSIGTLSSARFVAKLLRAVWVATNFHFSSVTAFPPRKIVTISLIPHFRQMFLSILFVNASENCF